MTMCPVPPIGRATRRAVAMLTDGTVLGTIHPTILGTTLGTTILGTMTGIVPGTIVTVGAGTIPTTTTVTMAWGILTIVPT